MGGGGVGKERVGEGGHGGGEGRVGDKRVRTEGVWGVHISLRGKPVGPLAFFFLSKSGNF